MDARPSSGPWMESGREAGLVLSAQRGELPALFELLRHYQRPLWRLCFALTRHRGEAELLMQEASRRAYRNLKQTKVGQPFFPWLARITRTLAVAQARRRAGDSRNAPPVRPNGDPWEAGAHGAHDMTYEQRVLAAFADLSTDEQMLLALRLFERLQYADIATVVELPLTATMHRIATLRERIEQGLYGQEKAA